MRYQDAVDTIIAVVDAAISHSFPDHPRAFITNRHAGTRHRHRRTVAVARTLRQQERVPRLRHIPEVHRTATAREAVGVVRELQRRSAAQAIGNPTVVVSLGGDGTHNHCLRAGMSDPETVVFLRVPLGSGNDASDTESLAAFLDAITGTLHIAWVPAVEVLREGDPTAHPLAAFNIASLGIDAFITAMHDRWRTILPGNTYRLLVDLAVLRYETLVNLAPCGLAVTQPSGSVIDEGTAVRMLIAMGVSGHRTYGDHMHVLPGEENVCVLGWAGLRDKLRIKRLFYAGAHVAEPITTMYQSGDIIISYDRPVPVQMDGEAMWLNSDDFPLRFRLRHRAVQVLTPVETRRSVVPQ
ncbi:MAG: diacylglycerol kinase family protein [Spirochaeta sp.]|jgi:diacylglycerol kinase family enzyme|nr:diacylglycerol kinase family protein [Spirochaeta sp.]